MSVTGFLLPTARTVDAGSGTWTGDVDVLTDDGVEATFSLTSKNTDGRWLRGQSFGFDSAIPAGSTIDKVEIRMEYRVNNTGGVANPEMQAFVSGTGVGTVRAGNPLEPITLTTNTVDITADRSWTRADLLDGTFELRIRGRNGNSTTDPSYRWDHIAVQVTYTAPSDYTVATRTSQTAADGTSHTVTLPNGSNTSGRLVVVVFSCDDSVGGTTVSWPSSPAFTEMVEGGGTETRLAVAYRFVDGTEGWSGTDDTITVTTNNSEQSNAHAYLISAGHHTSTAPEAAATANGAGDNPDPPSLTPSWGSATNLWISAAAVRFNATFTASPSGYDQLQSSSGGDANAPLGTARRDLSAASENPGTFTAVDGANWVATTIAVRPASTGTNAPAGDPLGAGVGNQAETTIAPNAAAPTGAGTANISAARVAPNAAPADATGSAPAVTASIGAFAGSAVATGTALQPTVDTGGAATNAPAGLADGAGIAGLAAAAVAALPAAPTAAGTSDGTTVETGTFTNAPAGDAAATGTAPQPAAAVAFTAGPGAAIGTASQPLAGINPAAPTGLAAGTAGAATGHVAALAGLASAIGEAGAVFITEPPEPPEPAPILYNTLTGVTFNTVSHVSQEG